MGDVKKVSPKRNQAVRMLADDIRKGTAKMDRFPTRLEEGVKCKVCSRTGRTMVRVSYQDGREEYLGKTCARYVMDEANSFALQNFS